MTDPGSFDEVLRQALQGIDNEDVRIFYAYFEELKRQVRKRLYGKARLMPGDSAVAHSALLSMFCDLSLHQIPLTDVDEDGCPMLWPLLLKYVERHCNKWNKYYRAKKHLGAVVPLDGEPADYRESAQAEIDFITTWEEFYAGLNELDRKIVDLRVQGRTLEQTAAEVVRAESTVSDRLRRIRDKLLESE